MISSAPIPFRLLEFLGQRRHWRALIKPSAKKVCGVVWRESERIENVAIDSICDARRCNRRELDESGSKTTSRRTPGKPVQVSLTRAIRYRLKTARCDAHAFATMTGDHSEKGIPVLRNGDELHIASCPAASFTYSPAVSALMAHRCRRPASAVTSRSSAVTFSLARVECQVMYDVSRLGNPASEARWRRLFRLAVLGLHGVVSLAWDRFRFLFLRQ
jgi:hypothetical protein